MFRFTILLGVFLLANSLSLFSQVQEADFFELINSKDHSPIERIETDAISLRSNLPHYTITGYNLSHLGKWKEKKAESRNQKIIQDLSPSTLYHISLAVETYFGSQDTIWDIPFITRSNSSGDILVYFNSSINEDVSNGSAPVSTSGTAIRNAIIQKIDEAEVSIDVAAYNINRNDIVSALNRAANRGVRVRYIAEGENANTALNTSLAFNVLKRDDEDGIMHHKFLIIDATEEMDSWVITGSTNLTTQQIATDNNNALFIQDQSLAQIFEMEFEEMWGSSTSIPNTNLSRFGQFKNDNTPKWLMVGDVPMEIYFSPSDNTSFHISQAMLNAQESISLALLLFTHNPLANTVIQKHHQGLNVRGLINDINASGSRFQALLNNGVNVHPNTVPNVQLHHKYAIIDAGSNAESPKVVTGSHNWTNRAENHNDENTLIIHDADIANIFRQEFEARWCQIVSDDCFVSSIDDLFSSSQSNWYSYPNPTTDVVYIKRKGAATETSNRINYVVFNSSGQLLKSGLTNNGTASPFSIDLSHFPGGSYFVKIRENDAYQLIQMNLVRD